MLKRIVTLACTLMVGAALFLVAVGCGEQKKDAPAAPGTPTAPPDGGEGSDTQ